MSIKSILSALVPFVKTAASSVDAEIAAIQNKANADIAAAKLKHTQAATAATLQAKHANWKRFQADYAAYLASLPAVSSAVPSAAPTGSTGPAGA